LQKHNAKSAKQCDRKKTEELIMYEFNSKMSRGARPTRHVVAGKRALVFLVLVTGICFTTTAGVIGAQTEKPTSLAVNRQLPEGKQTTLGLYVTAQEAYEMWQAAPDKVTIIDVRTPEEFALIGHAEMAWNVPLGFITYQRIDGKFEHGVRMNIDFVAEVKGLAEPTDTLLLMCRSGGRSAMAVNQLAAAGFTDVYNITDGMEGDKVKDPESVFHGKRVKNGWKNWGLPWTYSFDPEKILIEEGTSKQTAPGQ
jgi:rhodanese-related sulfurtransferase